MIGKYGARLCTFVMVGSRRDRDRDRDLVAGHRRRCIQLYSIDFESGNSAPHGLGFDLDDLFRNEGTYNPVPSSPRIISPQNDSE